jgi:hypothetical protein
MPGLRSVGGGLLPGGATPEGKAQMIGGSLPAMKKAGKSKKKPPKGKKKSAPKKPMPPKGMPPAGMPSPFGGGMM